LPTFVLATGEMHPVREFVEKSFKHVGITIEWEGKGEAEVGKCSKSGETIVRVDPKYYRPTEVEQLLGDPSKATKQLGWKRKCDFDTLIKEMMEGDLDSVRGNDYRQ